MVLLLLSRSNDFNEISQIAKAKFSVYKKYSLCRKFRMEFLRHENKKNNVYNAIKVFVLPGFYWKQGLRTRVKRPLGIQSLARDKEIFDTLNSVKTSYI